MDIFKPTDYKPPPPEKRFLYFKCPKCNKQMAPIVFGKYLCMACKKGYPTKELHRSLAVYEDTDPHQRRCTNDTPTKTGD